MLVTPYFDPAHHSFVAFAPDGDITIGASGTTPDTLPAPPTDITLCGYTNHPEGKRGLNNSYGFTIGQRGGAYRKRGSQTPTLSLVLRGGGAIQLLAKLARDSSTDALTSLCFFVGVPGPTGWTDVYRGAKINSLALALKESSGEAAEIEATLQVEAICRHNLESPMTINNMEALQNDLREPLFWHDVRSFKIGDSDIRRALSGANIQIGHNLERKGERPNWGDDNALSRTCYHLLEHTVTVSGDIQLHSRLPHALFSGTATAQSWDDITLSISNVGSIGDGKESTIDLTLKNCMPTDETTGGVEPKAQISHSIPFVASDYELTLTTPSN